MQASAEALLMATEDVFVEIRAPSRVGAALNDLALSSMGAEPGHRQYGAATGAVLFGYAARMARADAAPLPDDEAGLVGSSLHLRPEGGFDYEEMSADPDALRELLEYAATLHVDQTRLLPLIGVTLAVWDEFCPLAVGQLHRSLRDNGMKRRHLPSGELLVTLIRLGIAVRVIDEVAGEAPLSASDPDLH